jgi:hypothetical protein
MVQRSNARCLLRTRYPRILLVGFLALLIIIGASLAQSDQRDYVSQLKDSNEAVREAALRDLRELAERNPAQISKYFMDLRDPLMKARSFADVERFAFLTILYKPYNVWIVSEAQRARVEALLADGKNEQALVEAKSYYNQTIMANTSVATDLMIKALTRTRGAATAELFKAEQFGAGSNDHRAPTSRRSDDGSQVLEAPPHGGGMLSTIKIDSAPYQSILNQQNGEGQYAFSQFIAAGNLLLLSDDPLNARECFIHACQHTSGKPANLASALEGVARSLRAEDGSPQRANAFLTALKQKQRFENVPELSLSSLVADVDSDEVKGALSGLQLASVATAKAPPLEEERAKQESSSDSSIQVTSSFECSTPFTVQKISPTHFILTLTTDLKASWIRNWFMFRLDSVAGRIVRIDLTGDQVPVEQWWTLNPVYLSEDNLSNPKYYRADAGKEPPQPTWNGPMLPATDGQLWKYIPSAWRSDAHTFSFVHRYDTNTTYVAMRVPYLPSYNEKYLRQLGASNPLVKLDEVGKSVEGRPLLIVKIGDSDARDKRKPCILIYAGEHANEHDTMWAVQGAIDFLAGDSTEAKDLRELYTFLLIPVVDPDASAAGKMQGIITAYIDEKATPETTAYTNWFERWVNAGKRLDIVLDFHNVQSKESPHVACALLEGLGERGKLAMSLHETLIQKMEGEGFAVNPRPWMRGWSPWRLGGWLSLRFGPITLAYELNSQASDRHLNLADLKHFGKIFAQSAAQFLSTFEGAALIENVDDRRKDRLERWKLRGSLAVGKDAIPAEAIVSQNYGIPIDSEQDKNRVIEKWVP